MNEHSTIIVTKPGTYFLDMQYTDAEHIVEQDQWGTRYYAADNTTAMLVELEYELRTSPLVLKDVTLYHVWYYAYAVMAEPEYIPNDLEPIQDIEDSEDKRDPSYFKALATDVRKKAGDYIRRGQIYAQYDQHQINGFGEQR